MSERPCGTSITDTGVAAAEISEPFLLLQQ